MLLANHKISQLVRDNHRYASVLYYLGIHFFDYSRETLAQVCQDRGLDLQTVVNSLESVSKPETNSGGLPLRNLPVDVIVEYLKHSHHIFIKDRLRFIADLIHHLPAATAEGGVVNDLKFVFPLFVEDFIIHVYEEEDTLFKYVKQLYKFAQGDLINPGILHHHMQQFSLQEFVLDHEIHDDEMAGIRQITQDYHRESDMSLHLQTVYAELEAFEQELIAHAAIENNILFPKALHLEKKAKDILSDTSRLN